MHTNSVIIPIFVLNHGNQALKVKAKRSWAFLATLVALHFTPVSESVSGSIIVSARAFGLAQLGVGQVRSSVKNNFILQKILDFCGCFWFKQSLKNLFCFAEVLHYKLFTIYHPHTADKDILRCGYAPKCTYKQQQVTSMYVIVNIEEASGPVVQIMGPKQTKNV